MASALWSDVQELERRLRAVEPAVRIVPERHVRRVLHRLHEAGDVRVLNPEQPVRVAAAFLRETDAVAAEKLADATGDVLLLSEADDRRVRGADDATVLRHYWRLIFRAAVRHEVETRLAADGPAAGEADRRLRAIPAGFAAEAQFVLASDHVIRWDAPPAELYPALVAAVAELSVFEPQRLPDVFPTAADLPDVGVDFRSLADRLRPEGADLASAGGPACPSPPPAGPTGGEVAESDRMARLGNYTRAAVRRMRAARAASGEEKRRLEHLARSAIRNGLVKGLARALGFDEAKADEWFAALWPLVGAATDGGWPQAAKALYDLQKLAADLQGRQFAVAPAEWLASFGRVPLRRPLDRARVVALHTRLARVEKSVLAAGLTGADRDRILGLLREERSAAEGEIRRTFGPAIRGVFDRVGLVPTDLPERVAREKAVAELLDRICEYGFLRLGDLRDTVARNQLKLPDLGGPGEFFRGDPLLRADRLLGEEFFGVYHRGEVYLRAIQRLSSLFFGTPIGRAVTLYIALPFGGAFLVLMFAEEMRHIGGAAAKFVSKIMAPIPVPEVAESAAVVVGDEVFHFDTREAGKIATEVVSSSGEKHAHHASWLIAWPTIVGLALFFLLVIHVPRFRRVVIDAARLAWLAVRVVAWDVPAAVLGAPAVRFLWRNPAARFAYRRLGGAVVTAAALVALMAILGATPVRMARWGVVAFVLAAVFWNTALGRRSADRLAEHASDNWRAVRRNLIPGMLGWFYWAFRELLGTLDWMLYTVDERLRYRDGASKPSVAAKTVLAIAWFPIAYVVRFAFYLLVEPQVNPVKHFPVVTVSHKVIWPMVPQFVAWTGLSPWVVSTVVNGIPGIFGFLAWELLANWRLYAANRPATLRPVSIGHHGETGRGLLRPGFHSGTVPKLYAKLRAGWLDGIPARADRHARVLHDLHHLELALRRQCERELFPLWAAARPTADLNPVVTAVHFGCQLFTVEIGLADRDAEPIVLECRNTPDGLCGRVESLGWAKAIVREEQGVIRAGLKGFLILLGDQTEQWPWPDWVSYWTKREAGG